MSGERRRSRWDLNSRFVIGQPGNPMMERWRLVQTPWLGVYVHFIYREDLDPVPHDHPWRFWSFVLRGRYAEVCWPDARLGYEATRRTHGRWSLHAFPLCAAHTIDTVAPGTVTLVVVGRKVRTWGFWRAGHFTDYRETNDEPAMVDHKAATS